MSPPRVSVCVANYNGMAVLDACLESIRAQAGQVPLEVLVHDDASTDGSVAHIRTHHPDVKLLESRRNVGFCVANNRMAEQARGEYLLLLNNDAALFQDALSVLLAEAQRLETPAILSLPQYDATSGSLVDIGCRLDPFLNPVPNHDPNRREVGMVIGACLWIPKALWFELGGFPEWFGSIAEDMYLCCRARLAGYPVLALGRSGYRHWQGRSFGGNRVQKNQLATTFRRRALSERNKSCVMVICYPSLLLYGVFPIHWLLLFSEGIFLSLSKWDVQLWREIYWGSFVSVLRQWKRLWGLRRIVQAERKISSAKWLRVFTFFPQKLCLLLRHGLPEIRH